VKKPLVRAYASMENLTFSYLAKVLNHYLAYISEPQITHSDQMDPNIMLNIPPILLIETE